MLRGYGEGIRGVSWGIKGVSAVHPLGALPVDDGVVGEEVSPPLRIPRA